MIKIVNYCCFVAKFRVCELFVSLVLCAGLSVQAQAAPVSATLRPLYVYNFGGLENLTPEQQCNLVAEAGYAGLVLKIETQSDLDNLPLFLANSIKPNGPKILAVFVRFGFTDPAEDLALSRKVVELIAGQDIALWLILDNKKKPDVTAAEAEDALTAAVSFASSRGVRSALYPHSRCLVSSAEEALPFVEKIHRPDFGLVLNLCHELRAHNGYRLREVIQKVAPSVSAIVISGADAEVDFSSPKKMDQSTVQPLDHSAFDWAGFLAAADAAGIRAPVAFINFKITSSPREYLTRSLAAWRRVGLAAPAADKVTITKTQTPSGNFDLSHWKLTLPLQASGANGGKPVEISASQLSAGYTDAQYFYAGTNGEMVFWCPVSGAKTENTEYPRTELRELIDPANDNVCWAAPGTHVLDARCRVSEVPSSQKVIIGQIHSYSGKAKPLIKLQFFKNRIEALVKESPTKGKDNKLTFPEVGLDKDFDYQIKLQDGLLSVTVNGTTQTVNIFKNAPEWANQTFYFKAGAYVQDNEGSAAEGARVCFSRLQTSHAGL